MYGQQSFNNGGNGFNSFGASQQFGGGFNQQPQQQWGQQQQQPQQAVQNISLAEAMGGGIPSFFDKNSQIGATVEGEIVNVEARQRTDYATHAPMFWDDGRPQVQIIVTLQTNERDPQSQFDDGRRTVYVKGHGIQALRTACRMAGIGDYPRVGDHLKATFARTEPSKTRGFNDSKVYEYTITPKQQADVAAAMSQPTQQAQPVQQQMPAVQQPDLNGQFAQKVLQLKAIGKPPQEIAQLLNVPIETVTAVTDAQNPAMHTADPEF
ncbi:MAG: hypothetical protein SO360_01890 [Bifidobacterium tsurumiense]|uniref:hypothetical protein n=1 Tax=Bifidobacterium tsurumiense TaxID=356829 RepID=UPI002A82D27E|nr:hypothetical protein [Bifidobacterium tsurumiense]MDY4677604.1 hypothetical protein [Bifidobacterium tsurumiense]